MSFIFGKFIDGFNSNIDSASYILNSYRYNSISINVPYIGIARNKILALKNTNLIGEIKANWYSMFYNIGEWYTQ